MDNLEKFFNENRSELKNEEMIKGDADRFEVRYEQSKTDSPKRIKFVSPYKRRKFSFWKVVPLPILGSLALIAITYFIFNSEPFKQDPVNSYTLYSQYYEDAAALVKDISMMTAELSLEEARDVDETLSSILHEDQPLVDVLPEEVGETKKMEVVSYYAAVQLDALERLRDELSRYNSNVE